MKKSLGSRGPQVDMQACIREAGGNQFHMIIMAAAKAREIAYKNRLSKSQEHVNTPVTALLEIQQGAVNKSEYLGKHKTQETLQDTINKELEQEAQELERQALEQLGE